MSTPVKIFFRLRLQNIFPGVHSQTFAKMETMVSMLARCSKGGDCGFNVGALLQGWRLWFQCQRVVARLETMVSMVSMTHIVLRVEAKFSILAH